MPSLDQLLLPSQTEQSTSLVEGELVRRSGTAYLRVDGSGALWGPLEGASGYAAGDQLLVAVSQDGNYWVVAPAGGGGGGGTDVDADAAASTLAPGAAATAVVTEPTPNFLHFAFGIPRGDPGVKGTTGDKGDKGDKGDTGPSGASTFVTGTGAPSAGLGVDGAVYLDAASGRFYGPKAAGAWPSTAIGILVRDATTYDQLAHGS